MGSAPNDYRFRQPAGRRAQHRSMESQRLVQHATYEQAGHHCRDAPPEGQGAHRRADKHQRCCHRKLPRGTYGATRAWLRGSEGDTPGHHHGLYARVWQHGTLEGLHSVRHRAGAAWRHLGDERLSRRGRACEVWRELRRPHQRGARGGCVAFCAVESAAHGQGLLHRFVAAGIGDNDHRRAPARLSDEWEAR